MSGVRMCRIFAALSRIRAHGLALAAQQEYEQDIKMRMAGGHSNYSGADGKGLFRSPLPGLDPGAFWSFED
jgi:hypothetical protein